MLGNHTQQNFYFLYLASQQKKSHHLEKNVTFYISFNFKQEKLFDYNLPQRKIK